MRVSMWRTSQPKFWPKKPVTKVSGRKIVATIVSCLAIALRRLETRREVDVQRAGEQVAVGVDQLRDPHEVVVDVAEPVARAVGLQARAAGSSTSPPRASMSRCGVDEPAQLDELAARAGRAARRWSWPGRSSDLRPQARRSRSSMRVEDREERVGQRVEDAVDQPPPRLRALAPARTARRGRRARGRPRGGP